MASPLRVSPGAIVVALFASMLLSAAKDAAAVPIKLKSDPTFSGTYKTDASVPICVGTKIYKDCSSNAFINTASLSGITEVLRTAFDEWNKTNKDDAKWTLTNGGLLPASEGLLVQRFKAVANPRGGGAEVYIDWIYEGTDPPIRNFNWVQAVTANYLWPSGKRVKKYTALDVLATGCDPDDPVRQCPPLYPTSNGSRAFEDPPFGPWKGSFFFAEAFLAESDAATRTLKVYEGVSWGYQLSAVPEPGTTALATLGIGAFVAGHFRGARRKTASSQTQPAGVRGPAAS